MERGRRRRGVTNGFHIGGRDRSVKTEFRSNHRSMTSAVECDCEAPSLTQRACEAGESRIRWDLLGECEPRHCGTTASLWLGQQSSTSLICWFGEMKILAKFLLP